MANTNSELQTITIRGQISATSNKVSNEFKQDVPTKTVFFTPSTEEDNQALQHFGMTQYTSKDGQEQFFVAKAPAKGIHVWCQGKRINTLDTTIETPNFKSVDGLVIGIAITKGNKMNRDFFRVSALEVVLESDIETIEATNPFA